MKQTMFMEKYPIFTLEIAKNECKLDSVDAIISYFRTLIDNDPVADFIGGFDHYSHTKKIDGGEIADDILDAKLIAFCFGQKLLDPSMLSIRPRSIGVCEKESSFVISFLEAPMPPINQKMESWTKSLII
jgi:hypothetical protein